MRYARRVATRGVLNGVVKYDLRTPCMVEGRIGGRIYEGGMSLRVKENMRGKIYIEDFFFFSLFFSFRVDLDGGKGL